MHALRELSTRLLCALALAVFVVCDLGGFAHLALHRHVVCDEHGVVEHAGADLHSHAPVDGATVCSSVEAGSRDTAPRAPAIEGWSEDEGAHEACTAWRATRVERVAAPPPATSELVRALELLPCALVVAHAPFALPERWLLAPKHSPPLAA